MRHFVTKMLNEKKKYSNPYQRRPKEEDIPLATLLRERKFLKNPRKFLKNFEKKKRNETKTKITKNEIDKIVNFEKSKYEKSKIKKGIIEKKIQKKRDKIQISFMSAQSKFFTAFLKSGIRSRDIITLDAICYKGIKSFTVENKIKEDTTENPNKKILHILQISQELTETTKSHIEAFKWCQKLRKYYQNPLHNLAILSHEAPKNANILIRRNMNWFNWKCRVQKNWNFYGLQKEIKDPKIFTSCFEIIISDFISMKMK